MRPDSGPGWPTHRRKVRQSQGWRRWAQRERRRARSRGARLIIGPETDGKRLHVELAEERLHLT